jgi:hypothetical protein
MEGQELATIIDGPNRTEVNDFGGGKSRSTRNPEGEAIIETSGRLRRGKTNEKVVLRVLRLCLKRQTGSMPTFVTASDERGEDARLQFQEGKEQVVQIVTAPPDAEYGAEIARGASKRAISVSEAATWVRSSIKHKANRIPADDRRRTILALDARHAGLLCDDDVLDEFEASGPPAASYGFDQIWLVGPIPARCRRLA